jgi:hypothetical protein
MHTAICTFDDPAQAEQAVNRLLQSGFDRHAVHMEHRHPDGSPMDDSHERHDRDVKGKFSLLERLFGAGRNVPQVDAYTTAVERGLYVVIVEARDEAEAQRAQDVLHGMEAADMKVLQRASERPLRELVAERDAMERERSFGMARADMAPSPKWEVRSEGESFSEQREPERATASQGWGEQRTLEVVPPGEERPIASPELPPTDSDKPR